VSDGLVPGLQHFAGEMRQNEAPPGQTREPETQYGLCPGLPRRRSRRAHSSTMVHSALSLRPVTVTDSSGQPQVRLVVDGPAAAEL
jgi:hypothetical protein